MDLSVFLTDKTIKAKVKTETISKWLLAKKISPGELTALAEISKDPDKATCIEALEFASKMNPAIADQQCFLYVSQCLTEKAPRIKWESAKVIGNTANLFITKLDTAIKNLLVNTEHKGTVVRWSAAFALGEILKLKTKHNKQLLPAVEAISKREEKNSIKKIYLDAIKKTVK